MGTAGERAVWTSILVPNFFSGRLEIVPARYIRAMHPKTGIRPLPETIERILAGGWAGQLKIHGHRCQLHISADENQPILAFNRKGRLHSENLTPSMEKEIRRLFSPSKGWTVIDAEWLKPKKKIFVFDILKKDDLLLSHLTYPERWGMLPRSYLSPYLSTLPLIRDLAACMKVLKGNQPHTEGLVFKSLTRKGFADSSIIRCRRQPV